MGTQENTLQALMEAEDYLSGEALARRLQVSRNAVWKAIRQLRAKGYVIDAGPNQGYRLQSRPDLLSEGEIRHWLKTEWAGRQMEIHDQLDSTNLRARAAASAGAPHGYLVAADSQTAGRGRLGRAFFSPPHSGVYISYVLRPQGSPERAALITSLAAVATAQAIEALADTEVQIKWVNDLYIGSRKICGILCEASMGLENSQMEYAVLGIGINTAPMTFPPELENIATSVGNVTGRPLSRCRLIAEISARLEHLYGQLDTREFLAESRRRSNVLGKTVQVIQGGQTRTAKALDLDDQGRLIIETDAGTERLGFGEISLRFSDSEQASSGNRPQKGSMKE